MPYSDNLLEIDIMNSAISTKIFPILFVGDKNVGKFSIIQKYVNGTYSENLLNYTYGLYFENKNIFIDDYEICLQISYIPDVEEVLLHHDLLAKSKRQIFNFLDRVNVFLIAFDVHNPDFEFIKKILDVLDKYYSHSNYILVGTKDDHQLFKNLKEIERLQSTYPKLRGFLSTSSKTNRNIEKLFDFVSQIILNNYISS